MRPFWKWRQLVTAMVVDGAPIPTMFVEIDCHDRVHAGDGKVEAMATEAARRLSIDHGWGSSVRVQEWSPYWRSSEFYERHPHVGSVWGTRRSPDGEGRIAAFNFHPSGFDYPIEELEREHEEKNRPHVADLEADLILVSPGGDQTKLGDLRFTLRADLQVRQAILEFDIGGKALERHGSLWAIDGQGRTLIGGFGVPPELFPQIEHEPTDFLAVYLRSRTGQEMPDLGAAGIEQIGYVEFRERVMQKVAAAREIWERMQDDL